MRLAGQDLSPSFETPRKGAASSRMRPVCGAASFRTASFSQFVFAAALAGAGVVTNSVASSMATPSGVGTTMRYGTSTRGSGDRHQGHFDIALGGEIFDGGAVGHIAGDRREIDGADDGRPAIALLGLHAFHALVVELEIVAHAAVEDRRAGAAESGVSTFAGAADAHQRAGHRIDHVTAMRIGDRNLLGIERRLRLDGELLHIARRDQHLDRSRTSSRRW